MPAKFNLPDNYAHLQTTKLLEKLQTNSALGLKDNQVQARQKQFGANTFQTGKSTSLTLFIRQFTGNPLLIILMAATFISFLLGDRISAFYIFGIILASVVLGFWNEYAAEKTVVALLKKIAPTALVIRNGERQEVPATHLTIGDIVFLSLGSIIPSDMRLIETNSLEVNESALTGESKTVYKQSGQHLKNIGFMGTSVESGSGKGVVTQIGKATEFGKIAKSTQFLKPVTEFQKGLTNLGNLIIKFVIVLTVLIFLINAFFKHDILTSMLFSLAVAVGITPELLPVIVTVSLSHGAGKLAKKHVVVKQLIALESLGNIDVFCTDKTGTITEGKIDVKDSINAKGEKDMNIITASLYASNAVVHKKIIGSAIDVSLWQHALTRKLHIPNVKKLYEQEFDYNRRFNFSVVKNHAATVLFAKGAPESIILQCTNIGDKKALTKKFDGLRSDGLRIIAVAKKTIVEKSKYSFDDATHLEYLGYISFLDTPKKTAPRAIRQLSNLGVAVKIITGDNEIVTKKICQEVGIDAGRILTGPQLEKLSDLELRHVVDTAHVFARVLPLQKLKIIKALQDNGHTVGYMGDGINDLPALHNADVGICVNTAVDVAKEAASVVLLRAGIDVIDDGIREGRRTFSNTLKYIMITASSNFGNVFSAAGASFFLPFLPMKPVQLLLTNALYDGAQLSIPTDNVDHEALLKPKHWKIESIKHYMLFFGPLSSVFDYLMFGILFFFFHAKEPLFQTGWFVESLATQILIVFVIRTSKRPFYLSKPSIWLAASSLGIVLAGIIIPFTTIAPHLGFVPLPPLYFAFLIPIIATYLLVIDYTKGEFLKKFSL